MIWPTYILYFSCVAFIRIYKWMELQVLKLFQPMVKKHLVQILEPLGIVFHCPGDKEWTQSDNKLALAKCKGKYDSLVHIEINNPAFFVRVANTISLAIGECYLEKMYDCMNSVEDLSELVKRATESGAAENYYNWWNRSLEWLEFEAFNLQTRKRAIQIADGHYDLGNDLFREMVGSHIQYSCAYWKEAKDLDTAQLHKMELIARKLDLKPGMRVLDIGCGWGTLCKFLAENYKATCVGVTVSKEGAAMASEICQGLPVEIRVQDYRQVNEQFDRIVSIEMLEHVGFQNHREYFQVVSNCLVDDGIFLCHTTARNHHIFPRRTEPFMHRYVFPNSNMATAKDIVNATEGLFVIEDWHTMGFDFAKTFFVWRENFIKAWPQLKDKYNDKFYRMWIYYLSAFQAVLASRRLQLYQVVLSKHGLQREYRATR